MIPSLCRKQTGFLATKSSSDDLHQVIFASASRNTTRLQGQNGNEELRTSAKLISIDKIHQAIFCRWPVPRNERYFLNADSNDIILMAC